MRNRVVLLAIIAAGFALIGWAVFGRETDEEALRRRLVEMSTALEINPTEGLVVRGLRLKRDLPDYLVEEAKFHVPQAGGDMTRTEVIASATAAQTRWPSARIGWSGVDVTLDGRGGARVVGTAELTRDGDVGPRTTPRKVTMDWVKKDGEWMVRTLDVGEAADDE
jgi:hypothetical protein